VTSPVAIGEVLDGKYRVERVIGAGGMGIVVAATHIELGQLVAMKFLLGDGANVPEIAARFIREARAAARIPSEHVARVLDVARLPSGSPYIVMEYLEGHDLDALLRHGQLNPEAAADYLIQACDAMAAAHRLGIVHRDLKPANLFLAHQLDGTSLIKVLDFGISKSSFDPALGGITNAGALVGSPLYMSPEQMRSAKDVDSRTDIWSLGAVLFELLALRPPFQNDSITGLIADITLGEPARLEELRPDLPPALVAIVVRCLEKDPARRFPDVAELAAALAPFASQRVQRSVERAHRIVGSVPPVPYSSAPPARASSVPATDTSGQRPPSVPPPSLPPPPGHTAPGAPPATAVTSSVGRGTAHGWTGTHSGAASSNAKTYALVAVAALGMAGAAWFVLRGSRAPAHLEMEGSLAARPPAVAPQASADPSPTAASVATVVSAAPAVTAALTPPSSEPATPENAPNTPATAAKARAKHAAPSAAPAPSAPETKKNGLSMDLK